MREWNIYLQQTPAIELTFNRLNSISHFLAYAKPRWRQETHFNIPVRTADSRARSRKLLQQNYKDSTAQLVPERGNQILPYRAKPSYLNSTPRPQILDKPISTRISGRYFVSNFPSLSFLDTRKGSSPTMGASLPSFHFPSEGSLKTDEGPSNQALSGHQITAPVRSFGVPPHRAAAS